MGARIQPAEGTIEPVYAILILPTDAPYHFRLQAMRELSRRIPRPSPGLKKGAESRHVR